VVAAIFLSLQKTEIRWMTQNAETPPNGIRRNAPYPRGLRHADALRGLSREHSDGEDGRD
jgi:hypothetical protein